MTKKSIAIKFLGISLIPLVAIQISAIPASANKKFEDAKPVFNNKFDVTSLWSQELFGYMTEGSNSYRIPGVIKTANNKIIISADKRIENLWDDNNTIEQVEKVSSDNGETWTKNKTIVRVGTPKHNRGLIIDGTMVESTKKGKNKLIYLFNLFPEREGVSGLKTGNPWLYVEDEAYWKVWLRDDGRTFNKNNYVLKELSAKPGWFQLYKLPNGLRHDQITKKSQLTPVDTYVDNTYNPKTRTITGQVYENVRTIDLLNPSVLQSKATKNSIYDQIQNGTKYILARNNHNATVESYDGGKTWQNLRMIDRYLAKDRGNVPFNGNAVGSGIELKHQRNKALNGRLIYPMYSYNNTIQKAYYIYSDDGGLTWHNKFIDGLQNNSMEATFTELNDGSLIWFQRQAFWGRDNRQSVTKSTDGGLTWFNPFNPGSSDIYKVINIKADGNIFAGLAHFNLGGEDYFLFALPKGNFRYAGSVYITDDKFDKYTEVYSFDIKNKEPFAYNYPITVNVTKDYADVLIAYEWSPKTKMLRSEKFYRERPFGSGIQLDKLRITLKK